MALSTPPSSRTDEDGPADCEKANDCPDDVLVILVSAESLTVGTAFERAGAMRVLIEMMHGYQRVGGDCRAHEVQH